MDGSREEPVVDGDNKPFLTPKEVARLLMVSPVTVRHWAIAGKLPAQTTLGGHRRFLRRDVNHFARIHDLILRDPQDTRTRVLVVDDDHQLATYLVEALTEGNDDVRAEVAYDGFEAGAKFQSFRPDVVLLDIRMPGLDGIQVCQRIKSDPLTCIARVIAMTGYHTRDEELRITAAGAEICLAKPFEIETLRQLLDLPGGRPESNPPVAD